MYKDQVINSTQEIKKLSEVLRIIFQITKFPLSFHVAFSALTGYLLSSESVRFSAVILFISVLLLSSGGAILNNIQDADFDRSLSRTKKRVIASGRFSQQKAFFLSIIFIFSGLLILNENFGYNVVIAGIISVFFYNGIYTPLKKKTSLGLVPGAVCGMIPPLIGWLAGGGALFSIKIFHIMAVFAVWQFPHFFLVLLKNREDYKRSSYPQVMDYFPCEAFVMLTILWTVLFYITICMLPFTGFFLSRTGFYYILINISLFMPLSIFFTYKKNFRFSFVWLNGSISIFMCMLIFEAFIR